ncbi:unnamed protein product [Owenia fusiformis]|uniref:Protein Churchill n=1 Tax=Owenia fusiformis TaxID=6347 RepID=A0A8J1U3A8_OWEFU|nr:unnamed protein product [Owenia fusiformis]
MCKECVKDSFPERNTTCLENGSYWMNFTHCAKCQAGKDTIKITERSEEHGDEGDEMIKYKHICERCGHVIADHEYTFCVSEDFQEYQMFCLLCGRGEDTRSILPNDPRFGATIF